MDFNKLSNIIQESFFDGIETRNGLGEMNYTEIFKNPTKKELRELSKGRNGVQSIRAIISPTEAYMWNSDMAYHFNIRNKLRLNGVSVHILFDTAFSKCYIDVTDNTRNTAYYHKPLFNFMMNHPYLKNFKILGVSYYDEDIVGSWDKMAD